MKKCICVFIEIFFCLSIIGQSISVASFKQLNSDLTANTAGMMEKDQNGEVAALIKVVTTQTGFSFDTGSMGIVKTLQKPSEIWVYVPRGTKKMTVSHPQLGLLRDYYFPISINAARTYEMVLTTGSVQTIVSQALNSQYLVLKVTPANAVVELNNEILPTSDGIAQKFVKLGTYEYRVQAPDYHTAAGIVEVSDPHNKKTIEISLNPAYGWIEIPSNQEYNGAQVFIDNSLAGTIPMKSNYLSSGEHNIKIVKPLYNPYSQVVVVSDNQTTRVEPQLKANFSSVTINVENSAEIYVNGEMKGTSTWTGNLASGTYLMEAKKASHRSTSTNVEITVDQPNRTINLTSPIPIYGSANITSTPPLSDVWIDGISYGQTPLYVPQLLIGQHQIEVKREGYGTYQSLLNILEGQNREVAASLTNTIPVKIKANLNDADIYIDGTLIGKGSVDTNLTLGEHLLEAKAGAYTYVDYAQKINVTSSTSFFDVYFENKYYDVNFSYNYKLYDKDNIYISIDDKEFMRWTRKEFAKPLSFGQHKVVIRNKGVEEIVQNITIDHNHTQWEVQFNNRKLVPLSNNSKRYYVFRNIDGLQLEKIELDDNYTKVFFTYEALQTSKSSKKNWININPETYIQDEFNTVYKLLKVEGIAIAPAKTYIKNKEICPFYLFFQPIKSNVKKISLIEPGDSSWKLSDIDFRFLRQNTL